MCHSIAPNRIQLLEDTWRTFSILGLKACAIDVVEDICRTLSVFAASVSPKRNATLKRHAEDSNEHWRCGLCVPQSHVRTPTLTPNRLAKKNQRTSKGHLGLWSSVCHSLPPNPKTETQSRAGRTPLPEDIRRTLVILSVFGVKGVCHSIAPNRIIRGHLKDTRVPQHCPKPHSTPRGHIEEFEYFGVKSVCHRTRRGHLEDSQCFWG